MPIIGLNFKSIRANINEGKITKSINVNSSPVIEKLEKKEINLQGIKDVLSIKFKFTTSYEGEPKTEKKESSQSKIKIGEMVFEGEILYNSENIKEILKKWEKDKKIDDLMASEIFNAIFYRCLRNGIDLASELGLPPPIGFPKIQKKEQSEYIG